MQSALDMLCRCAIQIYVSSSSSSSYMVMYSVMMRWLCIPQADVYAASVWDGLLKDRDVLCSNGQISFCHLHGYPILITATWNPAILPDQIFSHPHYHLNSVLLQVFPQWDVQEFWYRINKSAAVDTWCPVSCRCRNTHCRLASCWVDCSDTVTRSTSRRAQSSTSAAEATYRVLSASFRSVTRSRGQCLSDYHLL